MIRRLKTLIRPLVPARLMARFRTPELPAGDVNIDVVVATDRERWIEATPVTVRAVDPEGYGAAPEAVIQYSGSVVADGHEIVAIAARPLDATDRTELLLPLADPEVAVSILGAAEPGGLAGTVTPRIDVHGMAVRRPVWDEVGGSPPGDVTLAGLLSRVTRAGHHLALTPRPGPVVAPPRVDPIDALGAAVILAAVPLHDVGGGFRGAQIAMELARRGFHVAYVAEYGSGHSVDLGLRFLHPRLEEYRLGEFDVGAYLRRVETDLRLAIVEIPSPPVLTATRRLGRAGFRVVYDLIDDWSDQALGGWWYQSEVEDEFISAADTLSGSARLLVRNLEQRSGGRAVAYVPNGVNQNMFAGAPTRVPEDIPAGSGPLLSYHGSLYGDWFDWDALRAIGEAFPAARVQVIGDEHGHPPVPANVHFLGLKPQFQLPWYLAQADVSLVPFKLNETTHAVSPLKAYESLAMGVPVAAPPLEPLVGVEGTYLDEDLPTAVAAALAAPPLDADRARAAHGWAERVGRLFDALDIPLPDPDGSDIVVEERPPRRFDASLRLR
ncbi:MAG: glycosyltransferase [Acidimicrobiia bacterium]|nr:glycosyltransferase [Acidimicrobiia bacterium]NNL70876.1 glycosyltransferase [Acidimicrobiia bacterium]